ncbi:MAG TPA: glycoside hydrolase family 3 N-terminal domain-containing protein [Ensifer sp.]|uniref:glycoside hydrolase family 3 N-terminal domain-containing protein n=1 Tax=Ensifer sp. TaxID=1872086 RepID=UPI002E0D5F7E|nr:glycoside hydrolase family 3 N-terminal domain-containing protein [Ensifer sp.]
MRTIVGIALLTLSIFPYQLRAAPHETHLPEATAGNGIRQQATVSAAKPTVVASAAKKGDDVALREMIGQMIIIGFEGSRVSDPSIRRLLTKIENGQITGVLYLQRNIASKKATAAMNNAMQKVAPSPVLIAIDQEGGAIQRIPPSLGFPALPPAKTVASKMSPRRAYEAYSSLAIALSQWGFNLNLGPVADLDVNPQSPAIGRLGRSFSRDVETVVQYAAAFVDAHREHGVLTALKHFPGHGSARADSHDGFVDVSRTSKPSELTVFERLIDDDFADLVMVGHTFDAKYQPNGKLPATLDAQIVRALLRNQIGYKGPVITDDLQMAAVAGRFPLREAVVSSVLAGNDLLVFGNSKTVDPDIDVKVTNILVQEAAQDPKIKAAIARAAKRVAALKQRLLPGVDKTTTRSIDRAVSYITPDFMRSQRRDYALVPGPWVQNGN